MDNNIENIENNVVKSVEKNDTSKKTYEAIIDSIKTDIMNGKIKPGQKLPPERELAKKFNVSRTSIREALRTLEILGVIKSVQGSGNYITGDVEKSLIESMSMMFLLQQIDSLEFFQFREALELKAAMLAVQNIDDEKIKKLEELVAKMGESEDEATRSALDKQLHDTIAAASKNSIIIQILNILSEVISQDIKERRSEILSDPKNAKRLQRIHEEMVYSLKQRDARATYTAFSKHFDLIAEYIRTS
ncbi:MAG: FadR family transcriptional regulator [Clostridiaceae bacterium]|nr:FadR family transcriptional regulator [Clostridiaceae bacterium]